MPHTRIVASALACAICVGERAHAQDTRQAAVNACRPAVTKKLQSVVAQAKSIEFISHTTGLVSNTETSVTGNAQYQDRNSGAVMKFIYQCTYNSGSGTASNVRLDRAQTNSTPGVAGEDTAQAATSACHTAATKQLRTQVPQADRVQFLGHQLSQPSTSETAVSGTAQYLSRNGTWTKLSYVCTYSARSRQTNNVTVRETGPVGPDDLAQAAITACQAAVSREVRIRYPNTVGVQFTSTPNRHQTGGAETVVNGSAQLQTSSDSRTFGYDCTYNSRSTQTSRVTIRPA